MNAKTGKGAPIGKYVFGVQNKNGCRLTDYAWANSLVATNCLAHRQPRRLYTWRSSDGTCRNQIDNILVPERWKLSIRYCKSIQGADCKSDHSLVGLKFQLRLHRLWRPQAPVRFDYSNSEQFAVELHNRFTILAKPDAANPTNSIQLTVTTTRWTKVVWRMSYAYVRGGKWQQRSKRTVDIAARHNHGNC